MVLRSYAVLGACVASQTCLQTFHLIYQTLSSIIYIFLLSYSARSVGWREFDEIVLTGTRIILYSINFQLDISKRVPSAIFLRQERCCHTSSFLYSVSVWPRNLLSMIYYPFSGSFRSGFRKPPARLLWCFIT